MKLWKTLGMTALAAATLAGCASYGTHAPTTKLYVLECGDIDLMDISMFQPEVPESKGQHKHLTDSCYLIVHPKGVLLWDAGLPDKLSTLPDGFTAGNIATVHVYKTLESQLKELGYPPAQIKYLGISHMHFDHVGNVGLVPQATLLIQQAEYDAALGADAAKYGFKPEDYTTIRSNPVQKLKGDYDVFGDGTVVIKSAPGHTPGHQALFVKLQQTGNVLLSGDLVHYTDNWEHHRVPGFNFDKAASLKTMSDTEQFIKDNHAQLWIQHDAEQAATLKHAPAYYE